MSQQTPPQAAGGLIPNDPFFGQQWYLLNTGLPGADLDAVNAWEYATAALNAAGDTIVLAVIDKGIDCLHPDLAANLWINRGEIPDDGVDNDGNGYIDDYRGWNTALQNDHLGTPWASHGTAISGVLGAVGDNQKGICGINWRVKIMFVAIEGTVSDVLAACEYVRQQRLLYQKSQGKKGAFVVALNCSWGRAYGRPEDEPLWCAVYDSLGTAGIVSVAATANTGIDVDTAGDLPSTCPSDYLITVTSLDDKNTKLPNAAWGATHIDLGAYGQDIFTTAPGNNYDYYSGTSYAAPMVTGAIGLLYAADCPDLTALAWTDPATAALKAKKILLGSTISNQSLQGITTTGGQLNLSNLMRIHEGNCSPCAPPFALKAFSQGPYGAVLHWVQAETAKYPVLRWRQEGEPEWHYVAKPPCPFVLNGLDACTSYEFSVGNKCSNDTLYRWSQPKMFQTESCCQAPLNIDAGAAATQVVLSWPPVYGAQYYQLRFRRGDGSDWFFQLADSSRVVLSALKTCTEYEIQVRVRCDTGFTVYSAPYFFRTKDCGACTEAQYCRPQIGNAYSEWIQSVSVGAWLFEAGTSHQPYRDFSSILSAPELPVFVWGTQLPVILEPGFANQTGREYYRIYVDVNADGDFEDAGELVFDPGYATEAPMQGFMNIPDGSESVLTRMRVMMKYRTPTGAPPLACETYNFGQVLDFCVHLDSAGTIGIANEPLNDAVLHVYPTPALEHIGFLWSGPADSCPGVLSIWNSAGRLMYRVSASSEMLSTLQIDVSAWSPGIYVAQIAGKTGNASVNFIKL